MHQFTATTSPIVREICLCVTAVDWGALNCSSIGNQGYAAKEHRNKEQVKEQGAQGAGEPAVYFFPVLVTLNFLQRRGRMGMVHVHPLAQGAAYV